jgi:hypothetical protein
VDTYGTDGILATGEQEAHAIILVDSPAFSGNIQ